MYKARGVLILECEGNKSGPTTIHEWLGLKVI